MEDGFEMDETQCSADEPGLFCESVISKFNNPKDEFHQHICAVMGAMSQELTDQNLPRTPVAYFGATCSSLVRLSSELQPAAHIIDALVTILSEVFYCISAPILMKKIGHVSALLVQVFHSKSITPRGIISGLKCLSHLLVTRDKAYWSDVSHLFGVLLGYITDDRAAVRRLSHVHLRIVLGGFKASPVLAPACEAITSLLERFILIAAAQDILHILDALKECLPMMSKKSSTIILKYFKTLLELQSPHVTKRITDVLNIICLNPSSEVSSEELLDLLCSLAISISANESSADSMTFIARLLDAGISKVFFLNRPICVAKLPVVFNALRDIMASEHEEAIYASTLAFKSLINTCIDDSLVKEGLDKMKLNVNVEATRRPGPTIIEKVCATIGSLIDYRYAAVWDMSFQVVSTLFDKLGQGSSFFLGGILKSLADMQGLSDEDFPYRKQLHDCVGSALAAIGPETFLSLLPLNLEAQELSGANVWLFPILKQYTIGAHLSFFSKSIVPMMGHLKQKSAKLEQEGKIYSARSIDGLVQSLWALLPSFCNYPLDTAESFNFLEKILCDALNAEPDVRGVICSSLQILIRQNKKVLEIENDLSCMERIVFGQRVIDKYNSQIAAENLNVLRSSARQMFSVLSGIFLQSSNDAGGLLKSTISEFASISDKEVVTRFFKATMQRLLKVTKEAIKSQNIQNTNSMEVDSSSDGSSLSIARAQLFDIAGSLLPGLDTNEVDLLFVAIEPALKVEVKAKAKDLGLVQKKAYKVLSIIFKNNVEFISRKLEDLLKLMIEVLPLCHFSAKRHRLDCLYFLIVFTSKHKSEQRRQDIISSFVTEIILALKEANKKTRNRAYDILVQIGHAYRDEENGGKEEYLYQFFNMVAGGLAGATPHMISAAVKGLARLAYEFTDLVSATYNILPSTFLLLQRKNKEIIKANLGLLKVLVTKSQADGLRTHLGSMVEGLMNWQDTTKSHFKAKVKLILEMLVKKCGLDAVRAVMPEEHMKLLNNIRKIKVRKERKSPTGSEETRSQRSKATTSRLSGWNHTKVFSDFGDEKTEFSDSEFLDSEMGAVMQNKASSLVRSKANSLRSNRMRKAAKSLPEDWFDQLDDEPLDLLDRQKTRSALRSSGHLKRKPESDDELEIDSEGRLIVSEGEKKPKREMPSCPDSDDRNKAGSQVSINTRKAQKRRKMSESGWAYTGNEYVSKRAGGDINRKDKLEPYAYWPLDRKMMSRRPEHRAAARKGMSSVVKLTKKLEGKSVSHALSIKSLKKSKRPKKKVN